jgi:putative ABC transport system permease protein
VSLRNSFQIAIKALRKNKLQTALTMIGMTIGVATVLTMIALGSGAQAAIQDQVRAAGMNLIVVTAGNYQIKQDAVDEDAIEPASYDPRHGARFVRIFHPEDDPMAKHDHPLARQRLGDSEAGLGAASTLTISDADAIRKIKGVQYVSEGIHMNAHIVRGGKRWFTRLHGDDVALPEIRRAWTLPQGRYFNQHEQSRADQVVVLGAIASHELFGNENPTGQTVTIWNQPFKVVGVVGSSSWMVVPEAGDDQFDAVYIPVTTLQRLLNLSKLNDITITTNSTGEVTRVAKAITDLLRTRHHIGARTPDDFTVTNQARQALAKGGMRPEVARAVVGNVASATMTALLASIATVSLVVGGIGIMNIMLLSVIERTREIGIRRAVGARSHDVLLQFLLESVTLSVAGGLLGILIGCLVSVLISRSLQWSATISLLSVLLSFGVAAAIGIFFGYYPARQASRVAPLTSLRYE